MRRRRASLENPDQAAVRFAWWVSFFVTLALVAIFALAHSAQAAAPAAALPPLITLDPPDEEEEAEESEWEEGEGEVKECGVVEEDGEEFEECFEVEAEEETPAECKLSSAEATVAALPASSSLRLAVRYTSLAPAAVSVDLWLRGGRGPLSLDGDRGRFGRAGVFRSAERLSKAQLQKVLAARSFTVTLHAVNAPRYCHRYFDRHLTARRPAGAGLVWSDPAAKLRQPVT